jgi:hypothetical protein
LQSHSFLFEKKGSELMSTLVFDGQTRTITLKDRNGNDVGSWPANNVVEHDPRWLRFVPNGTHTPTNSRTPTRHPGRRDSHGILTDTAQGSYGSYGAIVMNPNTVNGHRGVAVHSGRATLHDGRRRTGINYATQGCIRTTDQAMGVITGHMRNDPLESITVQNNRDQN